MGPYGDGGPRAVLVSSCEPRYDELGVILGMDCHVVEMGDFLFDEAEIDGVYDSLDAPAAGRRTRELVCDCGGWPFFVFAEAAALRDGSSGRRSRQQRDAFFAGVMRSLSRGLCGFVQATCFLDAPAVSPNSCIAIALAYLFAGNGVEALFWTDKLRDEIAEKLKGLIDKYGPETLLSSEGTYRSDHLWARSRFYNLLGNPNNIVDPGIICGCWNYTLNMAMTGWPIEGTSPVSSQQ